MAEDARRRLEALEARLGPRVMVAALRGLLGRGVAAPGKGWFGVNDDGMDGPCDVMCVSDDVAPPFAFLLFLSLVYETNHTHALKKYTAWLRGTCSRRMTAVLMAPGGLRAVMEAFLGGLPQQEEALQVRRRLRSL